MDELQYVVLRHEGIADPHFDLMFETAPGSPLKTWRSPIWPITEPTPLVELGDHRRAYLDYEGPLSGDLGHVRRVCGGNFKVVSMASEEWQIALQDVKMGLLLSNNAGVWFARLVSTEI